MCYTLQPTVSGAMIQQRRPIYKRHAVNETATFVSQEIPFVLLPSHTICIAGLAAVLQIFAGHANEM